MSTFSLDELRRWPDLETPELRAWDTADTLILDEAGALLVGADITVIGDEYGALTLGALDRGAASVGVHQDRLSGELALSANGSEWALSANGSERALSANGSERPLSANGSGAWESLPLEAALLDGVTLVLLRLPRSLDALDEISALIARHASPDVVVIAGGRIKHMTVTMNEVLRRHFGRVDVTHAVQKSRALIAREPLPHANLPGTAVPPRRKLDPDLGLWVVATGGVFAGASIDIGTRALLQSLDRVAPFTSAVDLGCGTGILAAALARQQPEARVTATDESAAAVASAALTAEANGVEVTVTRDDAASAIPSRSVDLVVLNPPFHTGAAVHSGVSTKLFEAASRILRPGGELWTVFNSHLDYRPTLDRIVGGTRQIERTPKFTVTMSRKR
ncbi:16S rRNA (guanine1207-N2)-methyltransferase [Salinibacterium sp. CAN_S4]|uniref:class I SAM-dependent methyltransferase n=1 Tax=Salinibacterium sp. CAN_S4 TaxID=2787727 RepID=UPI0018EFC3BA